MSTKGTWTNVSHAEPCEICHNTDWCARTDDGIKLCRRVENEGCLRRSDSQGVEYYMYFPEGVEDSDKKTYSTPKEDAVYDV